MNALVVGLVVAAAGTTQVEGAVTASGGLASSEAAHLGFVNAELHGRLDVSRDFARFFVEVHGSVLMRGGVSALAFKDLGSRVTFGYRPGLTVKRVAVEVLPFTPTLRLPSFDWANAWGNTQSPELVPVAPVVTGEVALEGATFWLSARLKAPLDPIQNVNQVRPDLIAGAEVELSSQVRAEFRGAWLQWGPNPVFAQIGINQPMFALGAGARLSWTYREYVGPQVDLYTYADDPLRFQRFFRDEPGRSSVAAWLALEGGGAGAQLSDPDRFGKTRVQPMAWVDGQARVRVGDLRLFATVRVQSANFIAFDFPGTTGAPFTALASGVASGAYVAGFLGANFMLSALRLTPGVLLNLARPASFTSGPNTRYFWGRDRIGLLFDGALLQPILHVNASLRWDVLAFLSVVGAFDVEKNFNLAGQDPLNPADNTLWLRGQVYAQARF